MQWTANRDRLSVCAEHRVTLRHFSFAADAVVSLAESMHTDWPRFKGKRSAFSVFLILSVLIRVNLWRKFFDTAEISR